MKTGMVRALESGIKRQIATEPKSEKPVTNEVKERTILHIDMDAFFAAVEIRDNPWLKGKPIIVGGLPTGRGVVTTASYEARAYGIHAGMAVAEAVRLCPQGIFVKGSGEKYVHASIELVKVLRIFSDKVEPTSIDEAFMDITNSKRLFGGEQKLAIELKKRIQEKLGLTCSIGIGPNRLVAKMASGMQKPDGLTIIHRENIRQIFDPLSVRELYGVGPSTQEALRKIGILTIEQLRKASPGTLKRYFGVGGQELIRMANGRGECRVVPLEHREQEKSMGHEHTFGEDTTEPLKIHAQMLYLSEKVSRRLREAKLGGHRVTLKLRTKGFQTTTHQMSIRVPTDDEYFIYSISKRLLKEIWDRETPIRLVGISVSRLINIPKEGYQESIFLDRADRHRRKLTGYIDMIMERYGEKSIGSASGYFFR
jgi:DNA polymerase-4